MRRQMAAHTARTPSAGARLIHRIRHIDWLRVVLIALFVIYWIYMSQLERLVDLPFFSRFLRPEEIALLSGIPGFTILVEMFHPRVLRHLIPVVVGWWLAVEAAVSLIQVFYSCPDRRTARDFLKRQRSNRPSGERPYELDPKDLAKLVDESVLLRVGGPVRIKIPSGHAGVTERNARFERVLGPGTHTLKRFEYVIAVIDLQPQMKTAREIPLITRDGIPLTVDASLRFSIAPGDDPTPLEPVPYREDAVRRAAYSGVVDARGRLSAWYDAPIGKVKGGLAAVVAQESLDKLIFDENKREVHRDLVKAVTEQVWEKLPQDGIKPLQLQIGRLAPPEAVSKQYTEYWLASQQKSDLIARANGTAALVQNVEMARAEAELAMMQAVVEGVHRAQNEAGSQMTGYLLALRLLESLRRMVNQSSQGLIGKDNEARKLMDQVNGLTNRLARLESELGSSPDSPDLAEAG